MLNVTGHEIYIETCINLNYLFSQIIIVIIIIIFTKSQRKVNIKLLS